MFEATMIYRAMLMDLYTAVEKYHGYQEGRYRVFPLLDFRYAFDWHLHGFWYKRKLRKIRRAPVAAVVTGGNLKVRSIWVIASRSSLRRHVHGIHVLERICKKEQITLVKVEPARKYHLKMVGEELAAAKASMSADHESLLVNKNAASCHRCHAPLQYCVTPERPIGYFRCSNLCVPREWIGFFDWVEKVTREWVDAMPDGSRKQGLRLLHDEVSYLAAVVDWLREKEKEKDG